MHVLILYGVHTSKIIKPQVPITNTGPYFALLQFWNDQCYFFGPFSYFTSLLFISSNQRIYFCRITSKTGCRVCGMDIWGLCEFLRSRRATVFIAEVFDVSLWVLYRIQVHQKIFDCSIKLVFSNLHIDSSLPETLNFS